MHCHLLDGGGVAATVRAEIARDVAEFVSQQGLRPKLTAVLTGDDPASEIYVNKKMRACEEVGIIGRVVRTTVHDLSGVVRGLNNDPDVHAYILQLPLAGGAPAVGFFSLIDPFKDADVFNPENVGLLAQDRPRLKPCTPAGVQLLLSRSGIRVAGKHVVVISRSNVVGRPLGGMLLRDCDEFANATVTTCHDRTPPELLTSLTRTADVVVVGVGRPNFLTPGMVKSGCGVVDVGINRVAGKIVGDCDPGVYDVAGWATPVPNGVGPMTICCLLRNALECARFASTK